MDSDEKVIQKLSTPENYQVIAIERSTCYYLFDDYLKLEDDGKNFRNV